MRSFVRTGGRHCRARSVGAARDAVESVIVDYERSTRSSDRRHPGGDETRRHCHYARSGESTASRRRRWRVTLATRLDGLELARRHVV